MENMQAPSHLAQSYPIHHQEINNMILTKHIKQN